MASQRQENQTTMWVTHLFQQAAEQPSACMAAGKQAQVRRSASSRRHAAAAQNGMGAPLCTELLEHGFTVNLHHDPATLYQAVARTHPALGSEVVLVHAALPAAVGLTRELRRYSASVPVVALLTSVSQEGLLLAMQAGIDACWPAKAPLPLLAESLRRFQASPTSAQPPPAVPPAGWELVSRGWKVQTPEGSFVSLTATERAIMLALARAPQYRLPHDALIRHAAGARLQSAWLLRAGGWGCS